MGSDLGIIILVLGLLLVLNVAVISNAAKTSSFTRKDEKSGDMPFDSDVFRPPPGHNAPQQVFLALFCFSFFQSNLNFCVYVCASLSFSLFYLISLSVTER